MVRDRRFRAGAAHPCPRLQVDIRQHGLWLGSDPGKFLRLQKAAFPLVLRRDPGAPPAFSPVIAEASCQNLAAWRRAEDVSPHACARYGEVGIGIFDADLWRAAGGGDASARRNHPGAVLCLADLCGRGGLGLFVEAAHFPHIGVVLGGHAGRRGGPRSAGTHHCDGRLCRSCDPQYAVATDGQVSRRAPRLESVRHRPAGIVAGDYACGRQHRAACGGGGPRPAGFVAGGRIAERRQISARAASRCSGRIRHSRAGRWRAAGAAVRAMSGRGDALWRRIAGTFRKRSLHFIVGVPRSGTSLCRMLLGCHPRVFAPSETPWLFGAYGDDASLGALVRVLSTSQYGPARSIAGVSVGDVHAAAKQFILTMFAATMRAEGKDVLLLKTPDDIAFVDEILEIFSGSIVIHLRRDVRDVALSTTKTGWTRLNLFGENNFDNAVRRWIAWEKKIEAARIRSPKRIVSVRYEDLVAKPEQTLRHILQRLRLPFDADMLRYWQREHGAPAWDLGSVHAAQFKAIEQTRAFAYRAYVPTEEQRRIIADHEADIVALGYQPGWAV